MTNDEAVRLFEASGALLRGHFKLTSGRHSDVYYEKFSILKDPSVCTLFCKEIAARFEGKKPEVVVGPTLGGIIIAYEVARYLGVEALYAERQGDSRTFRRGMQLEKGRRVLVVDDVLTTGRSVTEIIELVRCCEADIVGIGLFLDRSGDTTSLGYPCEALATVVADSWLEDVCPLCARGDALTQRGSRPS